MSQHSYDNEQRKAMSETSVMTNEELLWELYAIADDGEAQMLDALRDRAGQTWECRDEQGDSHWTNLRQDKVCDRCGQPRPDNPSATP
jgi:hypothetical protein